MLAQSIKIAEISIEEHDYITDFVDIKSGDAKSGTRYLIYNRQKKLIDIVKKVIRNELTKTEQDIAVRHWCNDVPIEHLSVEYDMSRSSVYRILDKAREKLEKSLKYVLMYDEILLPKSTEEIWEYVRKYEN